MRPARARATLTLARIEAAVLARSIVVLVGLIAGGILVWVFIYRTQRCGGTAAG